MDFALTEEQEAIFDMARAFGAEHIAPNAQKWEAEGSIPKELWPQLAELGFGGLYVSEDSGGSGLTRLDATFVFEALSMACPSVAAFLSIHNMCAAMIDKFGNDDIKERYLAPAITMEKFFSYCLTEPGSGSDAAALKTRAAKTNEGYVLDGSKAFISGGGYSDAYVVMARTGDDSPRGISALIVDDGAEGLSFGGLEQKMGWKSQPTRQVQFDACKVAADNLLGEEGMGFKYAMAGLDGGRLNISACSLGAAQAALNSTLDYMGERKAFGKAVIEFQNTQFTLAELKTEATVGRTFYNWCVGEHLEGRLTPELASMAKYWLSDLQGKIVDACLQLHGGYGYMNEYPIARMFRDARVQRIYGGTNEIMKLLISRSL